VSNNELEHLVKMANQIASNIGIGVSEDTAVARVVNHISLFWARPMREKICAHLDSFQEELNPMATKALIEIRDQL